MYRTFLSIAVALALSTMMTAQTQSGESSKSESKSATLTGCLSGPNDEGAYELKSESRSVEVGGSDELKAHVGHEVKLTGSWARSGSEIGETEKESSAAGAKKEEAGKKEAGERHFKVSGVTMVSDTCTSAKK
jgi:hypothetical protein